MSGSVTMSRGRQEFRALAATGAKGEWGAITVLTTDVVEFLKHQLILAFDINTKRLGTGNKL